MNLDFCPNKASKEFKEMSSIFGEDKAYFLWMRNKGNHLEKAPNGADSKLFNDLLLYFKGDRKEALRAKANVYRNEFLNWFGDWGGFKTMNTKNNLFTSTGEINWNYFELLLNLYHNNQPDSMFSHGRYTLSTRPENHFTGEKNTLNHIKFVTQSMLNLLEGKYDMDLPFVSEARASMQNQKDLMILAAMFHDVAKPYKHGDIHGWESADILRDLLGVDYDNRVAEWAVRHHMPMPFSHKAEFSLSNPEAIKVAKNIARDAKRVGIDANTAINAFVLINAADVINGRELDVDDNWAKKAGEEGLKKYGGDISVKNVLSVELKEKVALLKKAFDEIKDEDFGDTAYNYSHQERFDYNAFPEGGREDKKLPYLNNTEYNGVSKVVDENGEPLIVWHGGARNITAFKLPNPNSGLIDFTTSHNIEWADYEGYNITEEQRNKYNTEGYIENATKPVGVYFAKDQVVSRSYFGARNEEDTGLYAVYLNIKNPNTSNKQGKQMIDDAGTVKDLQNAIDNGNDGVIIEDIRDYGPNDEERMNLDTGEFAVDATTDYIVFNPNQIKSAVGNNGKFSKTNDNIYKESFGLKETEWFVKDTFLKQAYDDRLHKDKHLSIDDVLSYLSKSNTTASVVNLINFINKEKNNGLIPQKLTIRVVSGIDMAWTVGNILQGRRACYDADRLTIYIDADAYYENGDSANVILHEIMHAITLNLLNNNPEVRAKLESTLETYRKYYPLLYLRIDNHSLAEFVADIWTNPITIKRLLSIPYKSESLFDRILNILRQLLKPFFKEGTLSEKASIELVELLESTPPMRSGSSGIYYAPAPTVDQIQKEYDAISDKIRKLFSDLYKRFDKMPNKSTTRRRTLTEIFKTILRLKNEQSEKAIEIALETAAEQLGVINRATGAPMSSNNLYAWFINQELKNNPYENITPQLILDIYKHQIGFYRSILATIPDDASVLLNPTTRLNRQDVLNQLNVIENFWKHAVEMVGEREIDNMIDNFTGLAIPQELKENMKVVYRDWLHKNWFHGDITSVTSLFTSYGQSGNPIVKIAFHLTQYAELKTQEEMLAACVPILERFQKVNSVASWTKPGWQKIFWELNREGIPTGNWVRDINHGQYEQDLNEFVKDLNDRYDNLYGHHYIYDELGMIRNSVTGVYVEDEEWIGGVEPTYVSYLLELLSWKCEHANLRYTFDYYKERLSRPYDEVDYPEGHGLSLKTLQLYENIQNTINYYLGLCTGEDGVPHPELPKDAGGLTNAERAELDKAKDELKKISSPFEEDGTPKVDEEYLMAMEILTWQKFVQNKQHGSNINWAMFLAAETEALKAAYDAGDPSILANFYKYNSEVRIDPDFLESIFGVSEDISPADIIIKKIYQKCLENLTKVKDNIYTRDIEPFKNNTLFWLNYRQIVQDVMDNKQNDRLVDPTEDFNDVAYYYNLPYVDGSGRMFDIFGRVATSATPQNEILTWQSYIVNYYKDIAIRNGGTIPGVEDEYGNPIIFYGSDMEIADQVRKTMFTYEATWFDKKGVMHTELRPLPIFTMLMPIDKKYIVNVPTSSRFTQPKDNIFKNTDFVESEGISEQPKRLYYDNSEAYNKMAKNRTVKALYDDCIDCMKDMQKVMGFKNRTFNYKLPMMNADSTALLSRGNLGAILRSSQEVQNDDTDMRNIDAGIRNADGTIDFDIPLRLLHELKDMRTLSSDVVLSVMLYVLMAYNYRNKKAIQDTLQTIHDNLTSDVRSRTATDYDRFKDNPTDMTEAIDDENSLKLYEAMMDSTMYGMDTGKSSKAHKETTKQEVFGRKFGNFVIRAEGVMTLGLNLLSMFAGGYDSVTKMLRESIMNRYMSFIDLSKSLLYVHGILWKVIANIGDPLSNCKMVAMMKLNGLSKDYTKLFDNLNHNRIIRTLNNLVMGGYSMFDYFSNMVMLRAHYRNVRFYDGNVIPKGFYTAYEMRQAFKAAGKSWKLGALAHSLCKTSLWSVYEFKNHLAVVKDLYISKTEEAKAAAGGIGLKWSDFVTDKVKTDIRSKSQQRSALYNGMAPDNDRARYLKTVWGKIIFAMRHWYQMVLQRSLVGTDDTSVRNVTDTSTEQIKFGKSIFKPGKKVEALTEEQSASRMGWNFETNAPLEEIVKATFRALIKTLRMAKAALSLKIGKFKDIKLSNVEKYAIRGIITQLLFLELMFYSFIPIMNAAQQIEMPTNKKDAELSIDNIINNLLKYPILYWANAHIRSYESHKAEVNPLEPKAFIKTSSALMGALDHQTDLIDMVKEGAGMSTHTLDEEISTGSKYKYYTRGERYTRLAIGIWNNTITSLTIPGIKYNTQWYMNMYGDSYRQMGYDFSISAGNQQSSNRPKIERPKIERPKIERPKINRPTR